jgi:hypothetical protein
MIVRHSPGSRRITLGADKAHDTRDFVDDLRDLNVTPPRRSMHAQRGIRATRSAGRSASEPWSRAIGIQVHTDNGRLRSHPATKAARCPRMTGSSDSKTGSMPAEQTSPTASTFIQR